MATQIVRSTTMSIQLSPVIAAQARGNGRTFSVKSIDLQQLGEHASPDALLDDFRAPGRPFGPHPHTGFSAITYVFEDSQSGDRVRIVVGSFEGIRSPLTPAEPFNLLDVHLRRGIPFNLQSGHNTLLRIGNQFVNTCSKTGYVDGRYLLLPSPTIEGAAPRQGW
jgi:redox-sensitive bicupin YhaK (pirin superfamily)